jgi:hypothetical protein
MVITVIKDKSSYLTTDKILEVSIPAKLLNNNEAVKELKLKIETEFKNLPVTNVIFKGGVEKVVLDERFKNITPQINDFLKKYIKFVVTTPNFREYMYKFDNINITDNATQLGIENIKGVFKNANPLKNRLNIDDIYMKNQKGFLEVKNFKNEFEGNENDSFSKTNFNFNVNLNNLKLQANDVYSTTKTVLAKNADIYSTFGFKSLNVQNIGNADEFKVNARINGIETETLKALAKAQGEKQDQYMEKVFEKGFQVKIDSSLKDVKVMKKDLGGYTLGFNIKFLPTKNFRQKLDSNDIDFVIAKLHLITTPEMANVLMNIMPKSAFLFALAKKKNGKVILDLELKQGKLYSEGQLVK